VLLFSSFIFPGVSLGESSTLFYPFKTLEIS